MPVLQGPANSPSSVVCYRKNTVHGPNGSLGLRERQNAEQRESVVERANEDGRERHTLSAAPVGTCGVEMIKVWEGKLKKGAMPCMAMPVSGPHIGDNAAAVLPRPS